MQREPIDMGNVTPAYIPPSTDEEASAVQSQPTAPEALTQDQLTTSTETPPPTVVLSAESPEIPPPALPASGQAAAKAMQTLQTNPWIANSSFLGNYMQIIFQLLNLMKDVHRDEALREVSVRKFMYEVGKENAEISRTTKNIEAQEKLVQAVVSFANAGISAVQLKNLMSERGKAVKEVNDNIDKVEKQLDTAKKDAANLQAGDDVDKLFQEKQAKNEIDPEKQKKINEIENRLNHLKDTKTIDVQRQTQLSHEMTQMKADIVKKTMEGAQNVFEMLNRLKQADLEFDKQLNDAFLQAENKLQDGMIKGKEEAKAQVDRIVEMLSRTLESVTRAYQVARS